MRPREEPRGRLRREHDEERRHRRHLQVEIDDLVHQQPGQRREQPRVAASGTEGCESAPEADREPGEPHLDQQLHVVVVRLPVPAHVRQIVRRAIAHACVALENRPHRLRPGCGSLRQPPGPNARHRLGEGIEPVTSGPPRAAHVLERFAPDHRAPGGVVVGAGKAQLEPLQPEPRQHHRGEHQGGHPGRRPPATAEPRGGEHEPADKREDSTARRGRDERRDSGERRQGGQQQASPGGCRERQQPTSGVRRLSHVPRIRAPGLAEQPQRHRHHQQHVAREVIPVHEGTVERVALPGPEEPVDATRADRSLPQRYRRQQQAQPRQHPAKTPTLARLLECGGRLMKQQERHDERETQPRFPRRHRHGKALRRERHELQQREREKRETGQQERATRLRRVCEVERPAEAVVLRTRIHNQPAAGGMQRHAGTADASAQGRDRERPSECQDRCEGAARPERPEREGVNGAESERRPRDGEPN